MDNTTGAAIWVQVIGVSGGGGLLAANNLSDLANAGTARTNLGLGTAAVLASDTDASLAANSDTRVATQKATKAYVDQIVASQDAMVFKGVIDCSTNPNYPAADRGWTYRASVAGKVGGSSGIVTQVGDIILCLTDGTTSGDQATVGTNWTVIQANIDGAVTTPDIGVTVQAYAANLAAIAGLTSAANKMPYFTGSGAAALADFTPASHSLTLSADATIGGINTGDQTDITGNAGTVTTANEGSDGTCFLGFFNSATGQQAVKTNTGLSYNAATNTLTLTRVTAALGGNASTATALQTGRNINGVSFNGSADITVPADASTLTGLVAVASGGTGSGTAGGARTNLGLGTAAVLASDTDGTLAANSDSNVATQKAVKLYIDNLVTGLAWKQAVIVATTANGTLSTAYANGQTVDGVTLATGQRILIKNQTTGSENGIYTVNASGAPTRAADSDTGAELVSATVSVRSGTANADTQWTCTNDTITIGSTAIAFAQMSGAGTYSAGTGLSITGNQFAVSDPELLALAGLTSAADQLPYFTGSGTAALTSITSLGRSILGDSTQIAACNHLGVKPKAVVGLGSDVSNATTTLATTGMTFTIEDGTTYLVDAHLTVQSSSVACGFAFDISASGCTSDTNFNHSQSAGVQTGGSSSSGSIVSRSAGVPSANTDLPCSLTAFIKNATGSSQTAVLQFAAETTGTVKVIGGKSFVVAERIAG